MIIKMFPKKNAITENLDSYTNSYLRVIKYCSSLEQMTFPIPMNIPEWYQNARSKITKAQENAMLWKNDAVRGLTEVPKSIVAYKPIYDIKANKIKNSIRLLADDLSNNSLRMELAEDLGQLEKSLDLQIQVIANNVEMIKKYKDIFLTDAKNLQLVSKAAEQLKDTDSKKIKDLKKDITDLEKLIADLDSWVTAGEVAIGIGLAIVAIGFIDPVNWFTIWVGIGITAAGTIEVIALKIAESVQNKELAKKKNELTDLENDVLCANLMENAVNSILSHTDRLTKDMENMSGIWSQLKDFAVGMKKEITNEKRSLSKEELLASEENFQATQSSTNHYFELAEKLASIDISFEQVEKEAKAS